MSNKGYSKSGPTFLGPNFWLCFYPFWTSNFDHFLFISFFMSSCPFLIDFLFNSDLFPIHFFFISYSILTYFLFIAYSFPIQIIFIYYPILIHFLFIPYSFPIQFLIISYSIPTHFQFISYLCPFHFHSFLFISFDLRNLPKFQKVWICFFYQSLI